MALQIQPIHEMQQRIINRKNRCESSAVNNSSRSEWRKSAVVIKNPGMSFPCVNSLAAENYPFANARPADKNQFNESTPVAVLSGWLTQFHPRRNLRRNYPQWSHC